MNRWTARTVDGDEKKKKIHTYLVDFVEVSSWKMISDH